ncbi:peptidoglycan DD-metalloendopeptidase family protein [Sneathiella sp.]|uniref:murein hydrolase activator EnvC family protein n=1 Tax=Sneathiella sp. TaxID=1964365 RepID=UPI0026276BE5|nr:peptidoglycan DD-metalloendopeptidase family protein [Sneathiella sp.]MDF2366529.1 peptidoglycan DD-metalloendopeptidase family protein [Sneathiella sp.]
MLRPEFSFFRLRRVSWRITCGFLGLSLLLPVASWAASPDTDLEKLRQALADAETRQESFSSQLDNLGGEIKVLKQRLVTAGRNLTLLDQDLVDVEERLDQIRQVEDETFQNLSKRNADLAVMLSALVNLSRQPEGTLMGNPSGLVDSLRASSLLQSILPKLKKEADQLSAQLDTLASLRAQYATEREEFTALREKRIAEQDKLDQLLAEKRAAQKEIAAANKTEQQRLQKLAANVRDTETLMQRLEEDKARQRAAEQARLQREIAEREKEMQARAAQEAENAKNSANEVVLKRPAISPKLANIGRARHFIEAKGLLPLPVGGRIITKYDESDQAGHEKGIVIETRAQAAVISPFDGQIAFAGPFRHYGLLLIIDHGDGYHTLLSGMGSIDGSVGQLLLAGEPVGQMKKSSKENPKLYMELRNNGAPIDPVPWLMAENRKVSG